VDGALAAGGLLEPILPLALCSENGCDWPARQSACSVNAAWACARRPGRVLILDLVLFVQD